jgi:hypothetical protein
MEGKQMLSFEKLDASFPGRFGLYLKFYRAKVPGGWIVVAGNPKEVLNTLEEPEANAFFLPDNDHAWDGKS